MPTKRFKSLVQKHVADDPAFAEALLREGIEAMLGGDVGTGKAILRDYIKAIGGYEKLGRATKIQPKRLIRMLGNRGNLQAKNLFSIICHLRERSGLRLSVTLAARPGTKTPTQTRKAKLGPWRRRAA